MSMNALSTTVAVYPDLATAEQDWAALEASTKTIDLADAALVTRDAEGEVHSVHRHAHHGWGKGAVAGGVIGLLFPPAILAGAAVGAAGGGVVARLSRSFDRRDIKELGEVMDRGEIALVAITAEESIPQLYKVLAGTKEILSRGNMPAHDLQVEMDSAGLNA
ncbi:MAG TPA: DUF1269 domain-containing protein [Jatrophihabitans sp.]|nr:DUF1269 domain-containing protein [Jatrophihabitans sp.]